MQDRERYVVEHEALEGVFYHIYSAANLRVI